MNCKLLISLAGGLGFEPRQAESESAVLPLDDPPLPGSGGHRAPAGARVIAAAFGLRKVAHVHCCVPACLPASGWPVRGNWQESRADLPEIRHRRKCPMVGQPVLAFSRARPPHPNHRWKCTLFRGLEELGAIFEVHGIVVEPSPAPDEAVLLEDIDDLGRCIVAVGKGVF
jgi:hypothetical protein